MNRFWDFLVLICVLFFFLMGCNGGENTDNPPDNDLPQLSGVLSISASIRSEPAVPPDDPDEVIQRYLEAFNLAQSTGATGQFNSYQWTDLESVDPGTGSVTYILEDFLGSMQWADDHDLTLLVGLQVINTVTRETPADLIDMRWNATTMIDRMKALLDQLIPSMQGRVAYISIGNEVNGYLESGTMGPKSLSDYIAFHAAIVDYIHLNLPGVKVGVTITADGLLAAGNPWATLNSYSDVIIATYYPLNGDFSVKPPSQPLTDFSALIQVSGAKQMILQEVGYPAADNIGSRETKQSQFISNVFEAWRAGDGQIPFLNLFLLHDFSQEALDWLGPYYNLEENQNFMAYLSTLGLREADGTARAAWGTLLREAADAGLR